MTPDLGGGVAVFKNLQPGDVILVEGSADISVVDRHIQREVDDEKEIEKGFELGGLVGVRREIFLHARPEFGRDDNGDTGECGVRQFAEAGLVAENGNAHTAVQQIGGTHGTAGSKRRCGALMPRRPGRRRGEISAAGKSFRQMTRDFREGAKFFLRHGLEQDVFTVFFDQDLRALEAKGLGEPDGLAASVAKYFGGEHSYKA